jgi:hypothetical protein
MDIYKALRELYAERERLNGAVARLEALIRESRTAPKSTRGRKHMPLDERLRVSRRISEYWAARRQQKTTSNLS